MPTFNIIKKGNTIRIQPTQIVSLNGQCFIFAEQIAVDLFLISFPVKGF